MGYSATPGTVNITATTIGQSLIQKMDPLYEWAPKCATRDERSGVGKVTYNLAKITNSLMGSFNPDWRIGTEPPMEDVLEYNTVYTQSKHASTRPYSRPRNRPGGHVFKDMENFVPLITTKMAQSLSKEVADYLQNTTTNITGTFTGAGALDTFASDLQPLTDINEDLVTLHLLKNLLMLKLEAVIDRHSLLIFQSQVQYHGRGWGVQAAATLSTSLAGTDKPSQMEESAFLTVFRTVHNLDAVKVFDGIYNSAIFGVTPVTARLGRFLWIGLVDRGQAKYDLTNEASLASPGGSIMLNLSREPEIVSWDDGMRTETEKFAGRWARDIFAPQFQADGTQLSIVYLAAQIHT